MFGKVYSGGKSLCALVLAPRLMMLCRIRLNSSRLMDGTCSGALVMLPALYEFVCLDYTFLLFSFISLGTQNTQSLIFIGFKENV